MFPLSLTKYLPNDVRNILAITMSGRRIGLMEMFSFTPSSSQYRDLLVSYREMARSSPLIAAILDDDIDQVANLLQDPNLGSWFLNNKALDAAFNLDHLDIVLLLIQDPRVDYNILNRRIVRRAFIDGHWGIVRFLLDDPSFNPNRDNYLGFAVEYGHPRIVRMLLDDYRIDPLAHYNRLILDVMQGKYNGYNEAARLVEQDPRYKAYHANN